MSSFGTTKLVSISNQRHNSIKVIFKQAMINMRLVGWGNEQELLVKHLIFESFEWSESIHRSLQGPSQILGFIQAPSFTCVVDQNLDLLMVFVSREFVISSRKIVKASETFTPKSAAKKVLFKGFSKFTGKHLSWSVFLKKFVKKFIKTLLKREPCLVVSQ